MDGVKSTIKDVKEDIDNECFGRKDTCLPKEIIKKIAKELSIENTQPKKIIEEAKKSLKCSSEKCLVESMNHLFDNADEQKKIKLAFKPKGPRDNDDWLSNKDIDNVLDQWALDPEFKLYNVSFQMIDFDEFPDNKLLNFNAWEAYQQNYRTFCCVLNTDVSTGPGKHWFCVFIDMRTKPFSVEYFETGGMPIPASIHKWLVKQGALLREHIPTNNIIATDYNQIQKSKTECGVFSLFYIYCRLNGYSYTNFNDPSKITDDIMYKFRNYLYYPE
jgi:hypothetical protein